MKKLAIAALLLTAPLFAGSVMTSFKPNQMMEILEDEGYEAQLKKDSQGDPLFTFKLGGYNVGIYSFGCDKSQRCTSYQFAASFSGYDVSAKQLNEWNKGKRFGRAYVDGEGNAFVEYDVDMEGGITQEAVVESIKTYELVVKGFAEFLDK